MIRSVCCWGGGMGDGGFGLVKERRRAAVGPIHGRENIIFPHQILVGRLNEGRQSDKCPQLTEPLLFIPPSTTWEPVGRFSSAAVSRKRNTAGHSTSWRPP